MRRLAASFAACALLLAACGGEPDASSDSGPTGPAGGLAVFDLPSRPDDGAACDFLGMSAVLRGSVLDERKVWLETVDGGPRVEAAWPKGYTVAFVPGIEVRDETGSIVLHEGDLVTGSCGIVADTALLAPPFTGYQVDCGQVETARCMVKSRVIAVDAGWPDRGISRISLGAGRAYSIAFDDGTTSGGMAPEVAGS